MHIATASYIGIILVQIQVGEPNNLKPPANNHLDILKLDQGENFFREMNGKCLLVYKNALS